MDIRTSLKDHEAWAILKHLAQLSSLPWVCLGDFNEILENSEKVGGDTRSQGQMLAFRQALDCCDLSDLGYRGPKFTWCNLCEDGEFIK
jgi:hypothetical protein